MNFILLKKICTRCVVVDEMIAEVDIDGDGRIDFEGQCYDVINYIKHSPTAQPP